MIRGDQFRGRMPMNELRLSIPELGTAIPETSYLYESLLVVELYDEEQRK